MTRAATDLNAALSGKFNHRLRPISLESATALAIKKAFLGTKTTKIKRQQVSRRTLLDLSPFLVLHRVFDSFGNVVDEEHYNASGSAVTSPSQAGYVDTIFAYTGRPLDDATGLQNNLNRWYDAETGRWVSEDPIGFAGGDANLSRYVGNGVLDTVDPNGLQGHPGQTGRRGVGGKPRSNSASGYWSDVGEVFQGYGDAAYGVGEGIYGLLTTDPRQTVRGVADAVYNYDDTAKAIYEEFKEKGGTLRGQGELVGDVLIGVATGGVLKSAKTASKFRKCAPKSARTPVGRSGQQHHFPNTDAPRPRNAPTNINGRDYSGHAIDRLQERGFVPSVVENAIQNGARSAGRDGTSIFTDSVNKLRVVVDDASGGVITVIPGVD